MRHLLLAQPPAAALPSDPPPAHLDKSLSIALGSVLCVAIAYLIIASIQNCRGRRNQTQQQPSYDHRNRNPEQDAGCLLQLETIPVMVYRSCSAQSAGEVCPICLIEYEEAEEVRAMPVCSHVFHKKCIDQWLVTTSSFCPICRERVIERAVEPVRANCISNNDNNGEDAGGVRWEVAGMINAQLLRVLL